jgi:uncharacterized membrane protein YecN with MAPEG domain
MPMPQITALYAALLGVLIVVLALRVVLGRRSSRVGIGDGGNHELIRRIRAHGNAIENVPLALLLLLVAELTGVDAAWLHACGIVLVLGRLLHASGLSRHAGTSFGRFAGTLMTWLAMLAMCLVLLWRWVLLQTV